MNADRNAFHKQKGHLGVKDSPCWSNLNVRGTTDAHKGGEGAAATWFAVLRWMVLGSEPLC